MAHQGIPEQMKALRLVEFEQNYQLKRDVPVPAPGPGEVLIRIAVAGFCHTDYQVWEGAYKTKLPHTGSHEPTGTIAALGSQITGSWKVGDRVGAYLFRNPCGTCSDCKWHASSHAGELSARYCANKTMGGIKGADGGFAEYMLTSEDAILKIPGGVSFEQAAPMMCAGATIWTAIGRAELQKGQTLAIVGIGGLGLLGVQFGKALGYRVIAVHHRDARSKTDALPPALKPDAFVATDSSDAIDQISAFTDGIGLDAAVVCTDSIPVNDWILHRLHPRGTCVALGLPDDGFKFDAYNIVFREIIIKGSLHSSIKEMEEMLHTVSTHGIRSAVSAIPLEEAEALPTRVHNHEFPSKPVVIVQ